MLVLRIECCLVRRCRGYGSRGSCLGKEVRMSNLVGTLAKVALGVAAVKGAGYVAS